MRTSIATALFLATVGAMSFGGSSASQAQEYPWCAQYGGRAGGGGTNCGFVSYRQCMAAISGNGGYCTQNLFYRGGGERQRIRSGYRVYPYQDRY